MFARRPAWLATGVLGAISLVAIPCGLGLIVAPWVWGGLLMTVTVSAGRKAGLLPSGDLEADRTRLKRWVVGAFLIVLGGVPLVSAAFLSTGLGSHVALIRGSVAAGVTAVLGAWLGWWYTSPLLWSPWIAIARGRNLREASDESVRHVARSGVVFALLIPLGVGAFVVVWCARFLDMTALPFGLAAVFLAMLTSVFVPAWCVGIATVTFGGQQSGDDGEEDLPDGPRRRVGQSLLIWVFPVVTLCVVAVSVLRPARAHLGNPPAYDSAVSVDTGERRVLDATGLAVTVDTDRVWVQVPDGGGAGAVPLRGLVVYGVVVGRIASGYAVGIDTGGSRYEWVSIDRVGVRLDDGIYERFSDRIPLWLLGLVVGLLLVTPVAVMRCWPWVHVGVPAVAVGCGVLAWFA